MLLDISDAGSQTTESDRLISDFLGTNAGQTAVGDAGHYSGSDLLSGFMIQSLETDPTDPPPDHSQDLMEIFQEHDDAMREGKSGQSC